MTLFRTLVAALFAAVVAGAPALADPPRDADKAFRDKDAAARCRCRRSSAR